MRWLWPLLIVWGCTNESAVTHNDSGSDGTVDGGFDSTVNIGDAALDAELDVRPDSVPLLDMLLDQAVIHPDAAPQPDASTCEAHVEICNGSDDDCDGRIDEGFGVGAPCVVGQGICAVLGVATCAAEQVICEGEPGAPSDESCNGLDDDCDGQIDEETPVMQCYSGPEGTSGVGACQSGMTACVAGRSICQEQIHPSRARCDGTDRDCDGVIDEECSPCGNGVLDPGEICDDGNFEGGDGCTAQCTDEEDPKRLIPGVQHNVPPAALLARGFELCHTSRYDDGRQRLENILDDCQGTEILIGCRQTEEAVIYLAAEGRFSEVTRNVGDGQQAVNSHNEVNFYFSLDASWGFAPADSEVLRNSCDVLERRDPDRMCWHTSQGKLRGGWRCGEFTGLSESPRFERVIFTRTQISLGPLRGFGHHGSCDSFNGCIDAMSCAEAACEHFELGRPVSWREAGCMDVPGLDCDLFSNALAELDTEWAPGCNIPVVHDVICRAGD